jgi:DNA-directed RNA polymerase specialized sigma24 family protein
MFDESLRGGETLAEPNRLSHAVDAAQRGEARGWTELFERFHPDVHAYALARLGDLTAAEDVTQDVFVAAVRSIRTLRDRREPAVQAWFLHICRHKVMDPVSTTPPAMPPDVHEATRRTARSRSDGR